MKKLNYIIIILLFIACGKSNLPEDVEWKVIKEDTKKDLSKTNIKIKLNKKVDKEVLRKIALMLKKDRPNFKSLWIFYFIPEMTEGMAWATTHFTPDLKIEIVGSTIAQDMETSKTINVKGEIIGKWRSEKSPMGATLILYKNAENKLIMRVTIKDGGKSESEIKESVKNEVIHYEEDNKHGEFYILEDNGNLGMYDNKGKFDEAVKIR